MSTQLSTDGILPGFASSDSAVSYGDEEWKHNRSVYICIYTYICTQFKVDPKGGCLPKTRSPTVMKTLVRGREYSRLSGGAHSRLFFVPYLPILAECPD
jgi:hypothetical protein